MPLLSRQSSRVTHAARTVLLPTGSARRRCTSWVRRAGKTRGCSLVLQSARLPRYRVVKRWREYEYKDKKGIKMRLMAIFGHGFAVEVIDNDGMG